MNALVPVFRSRFSVSSSRGRSLVEQLQAAGVAVVAADLAVGLVEVGGVGEGWRERVVVGGGEGVPRRGQE